MSLNKYINPDFLEKQATHLEEGFLIGWIPGIITSIEDLEKTGRVKCSIPLFNESENVPNSEDSMVWVLEDYTVPNSFGGTHRKLEVGSQVALLPLMGNPTQFILIGCIPNRKDRPDPQLDRNEGSHGEVTPNGVRDIRFDEKNTRIVGYPNGLTYQMSEEGDWQIETLKGASFVARQDGNLLVDNREGTLSITPEGDVEETNKAGVSSILDKDGNYIVDTSFENSISLTQDESKVEAPQDKLGSILGKIGDKFRSKISKAEEEIPRLTDQISNSIGDFTNQDYNTNVISQMTNKVSKIFDGFDEGVKAIDDLIAFSDEDLIYEFDKAIQNIDDKNIVEVLNTLESEITNKTPDKTKVSNILGQIGSVNDNEISELIDGLEYDTDLLYDGLLNHTLGREYSEIRPISKFGVLNNLNIIRSLYSKLVELKKEIIELEKEIDDLKNSNSETLTQTEENNEDNDIENTISNSQRIAELERRIEELKREVENTVIKIQNEFPERFRKHISLFYLESLWEFPNPVSRILNRLQKSEALELKEEALKIKEYTDKLPQVDQVLEGAKKKNPNQIYNKSQINSSNPDFVNLKNQTDELGEIDVSDKSFEKLLGDYNPSFIDLKSFDPKTFVASNNTPLGNIDLSDITNGEIKDINIESLIKGLDLPNIDLSNNDLSSIYLNSSRIKDVLGSKKIKDISNINLGELNLSDLASNVNLGQLAMGNFAGALNLDEILLDDVLGMDLDSMPLGDVVSSVAGGLDIGALDIGSVLGGIDFSNFDLGSLDLDIGSDISGVVDGAMGAVGGIASGIGGLFGGGKKKSDDILNFFNPNRENASLKLEGEKGQIETPNGSQLLVEEGHGEFKIRGGTRLLLDRAYGELRSLTGSSRAFVNEGDAGFASPSSLLGTGGWSSLGGLAMSALGSGGIATGISIAKDGLMSLGSFNSDVNVNDPSELNLVKDSYNIDSENPLNGVGIGKESVDITEEDSKLHIGKGDYELNVGRNSSSQKVTEYQQRFRSGESKFNLISGEGINYDVEGYRIVTPEFIVNDQDWLYWINYLIQLFEGVIDQEGILMWLGDRFGTGGLNNLKDITLDTEVLEDNKFLKWDEEKQQWKNSKIYPDELEYIDNLDEDDQGVLLKTSQGWELFSSSIFNQSILDLLNYFVNNTDINSGINVLTWNPESETWQISDINSLDINIDINDELNKLFQDSSYPSFIYFNGSSWISYSINETKELLGLNNEFLELVNNPNGFLITYSQENNQWEWWDQNQLSSFIKQQITQESLLPRADEGQGLIFTNNLNLVGRYIPNFINLTDSGFVVWKDNNWEVIDFSEIISPEIDKYFEEAISANSDFLVWAKLNDSFQFVSSDYLRSQLRNDSLPSGSQFGQGLYWDNENEVWQLSNQTFESIIRQSPTPDSFMVWDAANGIWTFKSKQVASNELLNSNSLSQLGDVNQYITNVDSLLMWSQLEDNWVDKPIRDFELSVENIKEFDIYSDQRHLNNSLIYWDNIRQSWIAGFPDLLIDDLFKVNIAPENQRENIVLEWDKGLKYWTSKKSIRRLLDVEDVLDLESQIEDEAVLKWSVEYGQWIPASVTSFGANYLKDLLDTDVETFENIPEDDEVLTWSESEELWIPTPKRRFIGNLEDVSSNIPGDRFLLEWDSDNNEWTPVSPNDVEIPFEIENLSEIGDVVLDGENTPEDRQVLTFDAINLRWIPSDSGGPETTDDLPEGVIQLYYTDSRVDTRLGEVSITAIGDVNTTTNPPISYNILRWDDTENEWIPDSVHNLPISLSSIHNIDLSSLDNNHILFYNVDTNNWETRNLSSFDISNRSIFELNDVENATLNTGDLLAWNGSQWVGYSLDIGISNLNEIGDVDTTNISSSEGQILTWSEFNNAWVRTDFPEVSQSVADLTDTDVTTVNSETSQFLLWNESSGNWERSSTKLTDLIITDLSSIGNVDSDQTTPENNQVLKWDNQNSRWLRGFVSIDELTEVDTSGNVDEDLLLIWDGLQQVWKRDSLLIRIDALGDIENVVVNNLTPSSTQYLGWNDQENRWERKELPSIPSQIQDLSDVTTDNENEIDDQILVWNSVSNSWVRSSGNLNSLVSMNIEQLGNVVTDNIAPSSKNQLLIWNNSSSVWQRAELSFSTNDISDIDSSSVNDNDILRWSSFESQWQPSALNIQSSDLADFTYIPDNLNTGDLLKWDGSTWSPSSSIGNLEDLGNTNFSNLTDNQILKWNDSGQVWFNGSIQNVNEVNDVSVDYANISDNDLFIYNFDLSQWESASLTSVLISINQIPDVDTETVPPNTGYVIAWNGSEWSSQVTPLTNNILSDLSNVSASNANNNQVLTWDQVSDTWIPKDISLPTLSLIGDVDSAIAPQDQHSLLWDGVNEQWISGFPIIQNLGDINSVAIDNATLVDGSVIQWDNASSQWVNRVLDFTVNALNDITNVDTETNGKSDNDGIFWNASLGKWVSKALPIDYSTISIYNDINIDSASLADGQLLIYNNSLSQWENKPLTDLISSIDSLEDVDTTTNAPVTDNVLKWDGANWIPGSVSIDVSSLGSLGDVDLSTNSPNIDNVLKWNGSEWVPSGVSVDVTSLDSLGDVDVSSDPLQDNQVLYWDNNAGLWKAKDNELTTINNILDVDTETTSPQDGNTLLWDGVNSIWKPGIISINALNSITDIDVNYGSLTNNSILKWDVDNQKWISYELDITINSLNDISNVDTETNGKANNYGIFWNADTSTWVSKALPIDYSSINNYDDINIDYNNIEDSSVLIYNTSLTHWESSSIFSVIDSIDKLPDVDTTTTVPETGFALIWDGTNWIPQQPTVNIASIDEINDVDTSSNLPQDNQVLSWDQTNGVWIPKFFELTSINDIADVDVETTPPQDNNVLTWDGENEIWKPTTLSVSSINDIEEVSVNNAELTDNSILQWDTDQGKWVNSELILELSSLSQVSNVDIETNGKSDNYILVWDEASQKWVSQAIPFDYSSINLLEDVDTSLIGDQQVLTWIDSEGLWKPKAIELALGELSNVELTDSTANGKLIVWNEAESRWQESTKTINELGFSSLGEIPNVSLTDLADQQMLIWSEANSAWINTNLAFDIEDINNVDIESHGKLDGYLLVWSENLNTWQTRPLSIASSGIGELGDVDTSLVTPENNQILVWNNETSKWERSSLDSLRSNLDALEDVDTTINEIQDQQLLLWSETESKWIRSNTTLETLEVASLNKIGNVDTESTPPDDRNLLSWNDASSTWKPISLDNLIPSLTTIADITEPEQIQEGQILQWNSVEEKWVVVDPGISIETSDDVPEGTTNFYFTSERLNAFLETYSIGILSDVVVDNETPTEGSVLSWNEASGNWIVNSGLLENYSISDLSDVGDTSTAEDRSILVWDATNEEWIISGSSISDLSDVGDTSTAEDRSILVWDITNEEWVISGSKLLDLSDVDESNFQSPSDGATIIWNESQGNWIQGPSLTNSDDIPEGDTNLYLTYLSLVTLLGESVDLDDLSDVSYHDSENNVISKEVNHPLVWDDSLLQWIPGSVPVPITTDDLTEGETNLWFTETRVLNILNNSNLSVYNDVDYSLPLSDGQVLAWDESQGVWTAQESVSPDSTDDLVEGNENLYYKDSYVLNFLNNSSVEVFSDISLETLVDGDVLVWNDTLNIWENKDNNSFVSDILDGSDLNVFGDVDYSSVVDGSVLVWNETNNSWENKDNNSFVSDILDGSDLNVFGDVDYSNPQDGQVLIWDQNQGVFVIDNPSNITIISDDVEEGDTNLYFTLTRVLNVLNSNSIKEFSDVSNNSPNTDDVLIWSNFYSEWRPRSFELNSLKNVDDSDRTTNSLLFWNGGTNQWESFSLTFNFLPEISINSPQDDDSLVWDSGLSQWVAKRPTSRINVSGTSRSDKSSAIDVQAETIHVDGDNSLYLEDLGSNEVRLTYDLELPIYERGDILIHNGNEYTRLLLGAERQVLTVDRSVFSGLKWEDPRIPLLRIGNLAANYTLVPSDHSYIYRVVDSILITLPINEEVPVGFKCTFKVDADNTNFQFSSQAHINGNAREFSIRDNYVTAYYEGVVNEQETWSIYVEGFNYLDIGLFSDFDTSGASDNDVLTYNSSLNQWVASSSQPQVELKGYQYDSTDNLITGIVSKLVLENDLYIKDINSNGEGRIGNKLNLPLSNINSVITFNGSDYIEKFTSEKNSVLVSSDSGLTWIKNYQSYLDYKSITNSTYTVLSEDHGKILKIESSCDITLPDSIEEGFYVDIRKELLDNSITVSGNLLNDVPDLTTQYESITLLYNNGNWVAEYNGGATGSGGSGGGGLIVSNTKSNDFIANGDTSNPCNTSNNQIVCTLPDADEVVKVQCFDTAGLNPEDNNFPNGFSKYPLIIQPNVGQNIQGSSSNLVLDTENSSVTLIYNPSSKRWSISDGIFFNDVNLVSNQTNTNNDFTDYDKEVISYSPFVYLPFRYVGKEPNLINYGSKEDFLIHKTNKDKLKFNGDELSIKITDDSSLENDHYLYRDLTISSTFSIAFKIKLTKDTTINDYIRFLWAFGHEFSIDSAHNLVSSDGSVYNFNASDSDDFKTWTSVVYNITQGSQSTLYFNGRPKSTQDQMRYSTSENEIIKLGLLASGTNEKFNGIQIKDFSIFNRQLNEEERILLADE